MAMQSDGVKRAVLGYFGATISAGLAIEVIFLAPALTEPQFLLRDGGQALFLITTISFLVTLSVVFITALLPAVAACTCAHFLKITSPYFFGFCGALTGVLLIPAWIYIIESLPNWDLPPDVNYQATALKTIFSGIIGGLAFWHIAIRPERIRQIERIQ
jgi:hypothetical protein